VQQTEGSGIHAMCLIKLLTVKFSLFLNLFCLVFKKTQVVAMPVVAGVGVKPDESQVVALPHYRMGDLSAIAFAEGLRLVDFTAIDLEDNGILESGEYLSRYPHWCIARTKRCSHSLCPCFVCPYKGGAAICAALSQNRFLLSVNLAVNRIGAQGVKGVVRILRETTNHYFQKQPRDQDKRLKDDTDDQSHRSQHSSCSVDQLSGSADIFNVGLQSLDLSDNQYVPMT
jgi:hypothetical protein